MKEKYQQELQEFQKYHFPKFVCEDLNCYYAAKEKYIEDGEDDFIHHKFDQAYTSIKSQWVSGRISENTFRELTDILKRGVVV